MIRARQIHLPTPVRNCLLLASGIVLLLAWRHADFYFGPPHHETGDFAANALQIDDARHFQTLYGNYSRWNFNHPGPAFFYCYAWAEILFERLIPVFASPHQAHAFAGLTLQALFFSLGLGMLARHAKSALGWVLPALAALVYFRAVEGAFTSIWAPHVLMAPFFAFICCCGAMAAGSVFPLPFAVVCGCFLVHGHVAQPLFVVPIFLATYAALVITLRRKAGRWPWEENPRAHLAAGLVVLVFCLPLLIDALDGAQSNFARILHHLHTHQDGGKTLAQSAGHLFSFFVRDDHPEQTLDAPGYSLGGYVARHWSVLAAWLAAGTVACLALFPGSADPEKRPELESRRVGALVWLGAMILTLAWGMRQDGPMYSFNSFFVHALALLLLLLALSPLLEQFERHAPRFSSAGLVLLGVVVTLGGPRRMVYSQPQSEPALPGRIRTVLGPRGDAPVHLDFEHPDWPGVISVALALQRAGVPFTVDPPWRVMFGLRHEAKPDAPRPRTWRIRRIGTQPEEMPLTKNLAFVELPAPPPHGP